MHAVALGLRDPLEETTMTEGSGFQVSNNAAELYERYAVPYV